jgi:hypothetical protein
MGNVVLNGEAVEISVLFAQLTRGIMDVISITMTTRPRGFKMAQGPDNSRKSWNFCKISTPHRIITRGEIKIPCS